MSLDQDVLHDVLSVLRVAEQATRDADELRAPGGHEALKSSSAKASLMSRSASGSEIDSDTMERRG